ncbi:hypothetical protein NQ317_008820 [Molorchus minor]|uniref:Uncharacterized protein n=1 Tax=Molorchus minor TaxID=1323400 RepID=A0ABQ9JUR4_9CUCU|nr:hypothetical protein NQ317_008820 [Molorchus minor]
MMAKQVGIQYQRHGVSLRGILEIIFRVVLITDIGYRQFRVAYSRNDILLYADIPLNNQGIADVFFSMNFEASYSLPQNQTTFTFPPIISDTVMRKFVYTYV